MAFVPCMGAPVGARSFSGVAVESVAPARVASLRMCESNAGSPVFGKAGKSMWKENVFTGGFPGGEEFYQAWIDGGLKDDVPDLPDQLQAKTSFVPKEEKKESILAKLEATEFFGSMFGGDSEPKEPFGSATAPTAYAAAPADTPVTVTSSVPVSVPAVAEEAAVDEALYEKYYPEDMRNKAPVIDIFYNGSSVFTASVSLKMEVIEGLPTLAPPVAPGSAQTSLVPGAGGGLKLKFDVDGVTY